MALFDFLKRKKELEKNKGKKPIIKKTEKVLDIKENVKQEKISSSVKATVSNKKQSSFSYQVVREPHISEKATYLGDMNKYVFKVYDNANKLEIKRSIEGIYKVNVLSVNIIKIHGKKRRIGRIEGFKKGHIKAIVTIKEGQKIEIL